MHMYPGQSCAVMCMCTATQVYKVQKSGSTGTLPPDKQDHLKVRNYGGQWGLTSMAM